MQNENVNNNKELASSGSSGWIIYGLDHRLDHPQADKYNNKLGLDHEIKNSAAPSQNRGRKIEFSSYFIAKTCIFFVF